ncbi:hypothetical protein FQA39_LY14201 [Lamprigera yunnana]|nr:hypothetical protein FQA39_LY14201 [Lamprigera yunnana]
MDVDSNEGYLIKTEVIVKETFSFCEKYEDSASEELKTEAVDFAESFKCKEECNFGQQIDIRDILISQYICNECNFITTEKDSLLEHLKITKNVKYFCKECTFNTWFSCSIKEHFKIHNRVGYKRNTKKCIFKTPQIFFLAPQLKKPLRGRLKKHVKIHTDKEYKCKECDYKTQWKQNLNAHVKIHSGDEYKCKECDYKTHWKISLKGHMKIHTGEEYKCSECEYKTPWKMSLKTHVKIHTGDKYKCKECDYKTHWKHYLKEHVRIHTGNEFKCKECDYKTLRKTSLIGHIKIHTGDEYKCKECDYKTQWKQSLKEHMKIHSGGEYKCSKLNSPLLKLLTQNDGQVCPYYLFSTLHLSVTSHFVECSLWNLNTVKFLYSFFHERRALRHHSTNLEIT